MRLEVRNQHSIFTLILPIENILSRNIDKKSLETEFLIAICRPAGDKWKSKTLFVAIFDPRLSIVKSAFDCCLSSVRWAQYIDPHPDNIFS